MLYSSSLAPAHTHSCHLPVCFLQLVGFNICSSALGSLIVLGRCLGVGGCVGVECYGFPSELSLLPALDELRPQASLKKPAGLSEHLLQQDEMQHAQVFGSPKYVRQVYGGICS